MTPRCVPVRAESSRSGVTMSRRAVRSAGASPHTRPPIMVTASANASTRRSGDNSSARRTLVVGSGSRSRAAVATAATTTPPTAPRRKSTSTSVSRCRSSLPRRAPSAARTAISRCRATYRADSIVATLTPAIASTSNAAPSSAPVNASTIRPSPPGRPLNAATCIAVTASGPSATPLSRAHVSVNADSSPATAPVPCPARGRPNIHSHDASSPERGLNCGCIDTGTHASARMPVNTP